METVLRVQINLLCVVVLLVAAGSVRRGTPGLKNQCPLDLRLFLLFVYSTIAMLVTDTATWLLDGVPGRAARIGLCSADILYYAIHAAPTSLYILYADFQSNRSQARIAKFMRPLALLNGLLAAVALSTPLTGFLFTIDGANRYSRGFGFPAFAALLFGLTIFSFVPVILGRGKTSKRVSLTLLAFPLPMVVAAALQAMFFGLVLIWPTATIFLVAAALNIQRLKGATDHLTRTANRRSLDETLEHLVKGAAAGKAFGGILVDLDDFKAINDTLGHDAGDRALEDAAAILRSAVRQDDFVARYGGDEFVLLLPSAGTESLREVADRIESLSASRNAADGRPYTLSFSIGAALYEADEGGGPYLARLDAAMYTDKIERKAKRRSQFTA